MNDLDAFLDLSDAATWELPELARLLAEATEIKKRFDGYYLELQALVFDRMETDSVLVPGVGHLQRRTGSRYQAWDGHGIRTVLAAQVADELIDRATGEVPPVAVIVARAMEELADCSGSDNGSHKWRTTNLKARGIKPSEFAAWRGGDKRLVTIL